VLGYPRIGGRRELKKATESWWAGRIGRAELEQTGAQLRRDTWETLRDAGLATVPSNTFSWYDQVLDTAVLFGAVPGRFAGLSGLDAYFAMARGTGGVAPLELTKWFDTNYHYLVPELGPDTTFRLAGDKPLREYQEARALGLETRPVLLGPLSLLLLSKPAEPGFSPVTLLDPLLEAYVQLLDALHGAGADWVQLDEPALAADRTGPELAALEQAYRRLGDLNARPAIMVGTYFGEIGAAVPVLAASPVEAITLDFAAGPGNREALAQAGGIGDKTLVAGVIDGRNVWRADLGEALSMCASLLGLAGQLAVSTSCSLLHVPLDLRSETSLPAELTSRLAFARQKVDEVVALGRALTDGRDVLPGAAPVLARPAVNGRVRARLEALGDLTARPAYQTRLAGQADGLPQRQQLPQGRLVELDDPDASGFQVVDLVAQGQRDLPGGVAEGLVVPDERPGQHRDRTGEHALDRLAGAGLRVGGPAHGHRMGPVDVTVQDGRADVPGAIRLNPAVLGGGVPVQLLGEVLHHVIALWFAVHEDVQADVFLECDDAVDFGVHSLFVGPVVDAARFVVGPRLADQPGLRERPDRGGWQDRHPGGPPDSATAAGRVPHPFQPGPHHVVRGG